MGAISGLLGTAGGASGSGFAAPAGVSPVDLQRAQEQTQAGIAQQQAFTNAMTPGGLQAMQSQQDLLNQLGQGAQGLGPNPALNQLNQTTGQNIANQAALMAGQRGAGANTGLMARQIAQQGASTQQQAAGQAATLSAQRQLQQQQALAALQQQMVNQNQAGLSAYNQAANTQQGNLLGMQGNINTSNAHLAGGMQSGQANMIGNLMGGAGSAIGGGLFGGGGGMASTAGPAMAGGAGDIGGAASGAGLMGEGTMLAAKGGEVPKMADGGFTPDPTQTNPAPQSGPQSNVGKMLMQSGQDDNSAPAKRGSGNPLGSALGLVGNIAKNHYIAEGVKGLGNFFSGMGSSVGGLATTAGGAAATIPSGFGALAGGAADAAPALGGMAAESAPVAAAAKGGKVPALLSPGERYLSPEKAKAAAQGRVSPMAAGAKVPGKPKVGGAKNDYANDTVKAELEPGGVVIPRSVTMSKDAEKKAVAFLQAVMAKHGGMKGKK